jgi:hypothetical protein
MPFIGNKPSAVPLTSADIADSIITSAKIVDGTIVNADINASAAIVSTKLSGSFGITEADQWRLTADSLGLNGDITTNLERNDTSGFSVLGTGMTQSSGIFTFPSTGYWYVIFILSASNSTAADNIGNHIKVTIDNSNYNTFAEGNSHCAGSAQTQNAQAIVDAIIDVTSTANVKVKFASQSIQGTTTVYGGTSYNVTSMTFIRLGDT